MTGIAFLLSRFFFPWFGLLCPYFTLVFPLFSPSVETILVTLKLQSFQVLSYVELSRNKTKFLNVLFTPHPITFYSFCLTGIKINFIKLPLNIPRLNSGCYSVLIRSDTLVKRFFLQWYLLSGYIFD